MATRTRRPHLITSPTEGLLYLPLIKSRVPVEWSGLTVKKGPASADYGCITVGQVQMQGSQSGVISGDLFRQVMALLTQGPGAWSGKLGDSFDAFEKIIAEIEQTESPTPDQFKKFQNIGKIVVKALDEWDNSLDEYKGKNNPAADRILNLIAEWKPAIVAAAETTPPTKAVVSAIKPKATEALRNYNTGNVMEKVLVAIKSGKDNATVDLSALLEGFCSDPVTVIGATKKTYLDDKAYFPTQIGCNSPINIAELSLSDDKTKINGLNLQGTPEDIQAIWKWLDIRRDGQFKIIDQDNLTRIALENETLYLVRSPLIGRDVKVEWDPTLSGTLTNTVNTGHNLSQKSLGSTEAVYTSVFQTGLPHKSTFTKDGRNVKLEIMTADKRNTSLKSPEFDITKYANLIANQLKDYAFVKRKSSLNDLKNSTNGLNYYFGFTLFDIDKFNEEEKDKRFAYNLEELKNGISLGVKADDDIPIPSLTLPEVDVNVGVCNYKFKAGAYVKISANAEMSGMIKAGNRIYINNEKPPETVSPHLEAEITVKVYAGFNPKVEIDLCKGAKVEFGAKAGGTLDFMKIAPPASASDAWVTYPFLSDGLELDGSIYYDIKVGNILEYHGTWVAKKFKTSEIFK
ncbi:hypothetical protein MCERE19_01627 [Spirosomataceae bacterium]